MTRTKSSIGISVITLFGARWLAWRVARPTPLPVAARARPAPAGMARRARQCLRVSWDGRRAAQCWAPDLWHGRLSGSGGCESLYASADESPAH